MPTLYNTNEVKITREEFNRLKTLLEYKELPDEHRCVGFANGFEFEFSNDKSITFDVHLGGYNAYDNVMLRGKEYDDLENFQCTFSIDEVMEFTYKDDTYICRFIIV